VTGLAGGVGSSLRGDKDKPKGSSAVNCRRKSVTAIMAMCETSTSKAIVAAVLCAIAIGGCLFGGRASTGISLASRPGNATTWGRATLFDSSYESRLQNKHHTIGRRESIIVTKDLAGLQKTWSRRSASFVSTTQHRFTKQAVGRLAQAIACSGKQAHINGTALLDTIDMAVEEVLLALVCGKPIAMVHLDCEVQLLKGEPLIFQQGSGGNGKLSLQPSDSAYRLLQRDISEAMQYKDPGFVFMLPLSPCNTKEDQSLESPDTGGQDGKKHLPILLEQISSEAPVTYSSLWTFKPDAAQQIKQLSSEAANHLHRKVFFVVFEAAWDKEAVPSAEVGMTLPETVISGWRTHRSDVIKAAIRLAQQHQHSVFVFDVGLLGPILIHSMYRANPSNAYLDMEGSLSASDDRKVAREMMPLAKCTQTAYDRRGVHVKRRQISK